MRETSANVSGLSIPIVITRYMSDRRNELLVVRYGFNGDPVRRRPYYRLHEHRLRRLRTSPFALTDAAPWVSATDPDPDSIEPDTASFAKPFCLVVG